MKLLAIDPGPVRSAWVLYDTERQTIKAHAISQNDGLVSRLESGGFNGIDRMVVEYPAPRGQPMYTQLVDTIFWIGRFVQAYGFSWEPIDRKDIKMHLCESTRAKDANIRAALISYFSKMPDQGGGKIPAIGLKNKPGPLFGISKDLWAALAVAVTYSEIKAQDVMTCLQ